MWTIRGRRRRPITTLGAQMLHSQGREFPGHGFINRECFLRAENLETRDRFKFLKSYGLISQAWQNGIIAPRPFPALGLRRETANVNDVRFNQDLAVLIQELQLFSCLLK